MLDKYFGIESDSWMTSGQYKPQIFQQNVKSVSQRL